MQEGRAGGKFRCGRTVSSAGVNTALTLQSVCLPGSDSGPWLVGQTGLWSDVTRAQGTKPPRLAPCPFWRKWDSGCVLALLHCLRHLRAGGEVAVSPRSFLTPPPEGGQVAPAQPSGFVTERLGLMGAGIGMKRNGCRSPRAVASARAPGCFACGHILAGPQLQKSCVRFHQWPLRWQKHVNAISLSFRQLWKH